MPGGAPLLCPIKIWEQIDSLYELPASTLILGARMLVKDGMDQGKREEKKSQSLPSSSAISTLDLTSMNGGQQLPLLFVSFWAPGGVGIDQIEGRVDGKVTN